MKQTELNLYRIIRQTVGLVGVACVVSMLSTPVMGASATGCEDLPQNDNNEFINQEIALCSVHAYNIGSGKNPSSAAGRQVMDEVVALKTTVITQQMKKQYDYLEATMKRFKTQLEKAILTAQMEAAGAAPSNSGGSSSANSGDRNIYIAGTDNCNNKSSRMEVYQCLRQNYNVIYNMSSGGQTISLDIRRQLANDYTVSLGNIKSISGVNPFHKEDMQKTCSEFQSISGRDTVTACLNGLNADIRNATDALNQPARTGNQQGWQ